MPSNENTKSQIKSRQRVAQHGEVFTNPREVNAMLDLVRDESFRLDSRFLEPACGDGNFLIEILRRKLSLLRDIKSPTEWEFQSLIAVGSCYGIELLEDNAEACRERLFAEVMGRMDKLDCTGGYEESLRYMLQKNIVCGDATHCGEHAVLAPRLPVRFPCQPDAPVFPFRRAGRGTELRRTHQVIFPHPLHSAIHPRIPESATNTLTR